MSGQGHTFRVREIGKITDIDGEAFTGVALEGATCGVRAIGRHLGADVVVVPADAHDAMLAALKDVEIFARANKGTMFTRGQEEALTALAEAARAALSAAEGSPMETDMSPALEAIAAERLRQVEVEDWAPDHDDHHTKGELARAAACYAITASVGSPKSLSGYLQGAIEYLWPWAFLLLKPKGSRRDLVRAGALIVAEIERIDRAKRAKDPTS